MSEYKDGLKPCGIKKEKPNETHIAYVISDRDTCGGIGPWRRSGIGLRSSSIHYRNRDGPEGRRFHLYTARRNDRTHDGKK